MKSESDKLIRILIVEEGLHKAEIITSALRNAGLHILAEHAEDAEDMQEIISQKPLELILFSLELPDFSLQQAQKLVRECGRHLYIIGVAEEINEVMAVEAMKLGAQDVVSLKSLERLALVVKREAANIKTWRQTMRNEKDLHESEKRCQSLLANSKDAVAYVHEGMHIYANQPYLELFGNTDIDELEGMPLIDMVDKSQQDELKQYLRDLSQKKNTSNELKLKLLHASGETIDGLLEFSRATFEGETCTQILIRSQDDTTELEKQISYMHQHDLVTGLYNRQYLMDELQKRMDDAVNSKSRSFLVYIIIDNFQNIRNTVGISGCDILINDIAKILRQHASDKEVVARFGAYTYSILCTDKKREEAEQKTLELLKQIEHHISETGQQSISCTCSAALYSIDENIPDSPNEIIARVDRTLDKVQQKGGNLAQFYVPVSGELSQQEIDGEIAKHIKTAIANNTVTALFQPIVSISGTPGERYEIKKVIVTPDGKELTEEDFMEAAERTGMAKMLDRWAIITAIKQIAVAARADRKVDIFIPLSHDGIQDATLARWVSARIQSAKIAGEHLVFTINEAHAVSQLKAVKTLFKGLKQLHCQIVLDEFGTGLNPFQLVKHIQPDFLRINHAYVEGLNNSPENQDSIREITSQASSMEISSILPGVSDAGVLSVLWSVGADFVQGDFLQEPSKSLNFDFSSMAG
jgi:diguanylate cyclase (GGDEF)-like protein/PAS domain S-box-containing protein